MTTIISRLSIHCHTCVTAYIANLPA